MAIGAVATGFDIGLLTFKTADFLVAVQSAVGTLGVLALAAAVSRRYDRPSRVRLVVAVVGTALVAAGAAGLALKWSGVPALIAQTTPYPWGAMPAGAHGSNPVHLPAFVSPGDPSVVDVSRPGTRCPAAATTPRPCW